MKTASIILILITAFSVVQSAKAQTTDHTKPFILGQIIEMKSEELAEKRTLNIYLPAGYSQEDSTRYPVIYLLDGSADEDFIHLVGLVQFNNFSWFNKYILISPSLWWDNGSLLNQSSDLLTESFSQNTGIYLGVGKEGLAPSTSPHMMEVNANLLAEKLGKGKSKTVQVHFDYLPQEDHATITHQAIFNVFRILYPLKSKE